MWSRTQPILAGRPTRTALWCAWRRMFSLKSPATKLRSALPAELHCLVRLQSVAVVPQPLYLPQDLLQLFEAHSSIAVTRASAPRSSQTFQAQQRCMRGLNWVICIQVGAIHAGLECTILLVEVPGMNAESYCCLSCSLAACRWEPSMQAWSAASSWRRCLAWTRCPTAPPSRARTAPTSAWRSPPLLPSGRPRSRSWGDWLPDGRTHGTIAHSAACWATASRPAASKVGCLCGSTSMQGIALVVCHSDKGCLLNALKNS